MSDRVNFYSGREDTYIPWIQQLIEVSVFLFLIVPSMIVSFFAVKQGSLGFVLTALSVIFRDLALVSLVFFFLWRNGEPIGRLGLTFQNGFREIIAGILLFFPMNVLAGLAARALEAAGLSAPATPQPSFLTAAGAAEYVLASVLVIIVAITEETIFRGYIMLRLRAVTRSMTAAVLLSAGIFALGHGYEGSAAVVTISFLGLVFALVYIWRGSLVAPMVMHFIQDFSGIVLLPLLDK